MHLPRRWNGSFSPLFVKCLKSLPNLHTLEVGKWADDTTTAPLKKALRRVKLPQVKTLIIPTAAHPLLRHCHDVEEILCVTMTNSQTPHGFHGSLVSNRDSKIKRLAIPLTLWPDPSRK